MVMGLSFFFFFFFKAFYVIVIELNLLCVLISLFLCSIQLIIMILRVFEKKLFFQAALDHECNRRVM